MEVYPECVDAMVGGLNGEKELLQSVALRVAHIEGRGEHKVPSPCGSFTHSHQGCVLTHSDRFVP